MPVRLLMLAYWDQEKQEDSFESHQSEQASKKKQSRNMSLTLTQARRAALGEMASLGPRAFGALQDCSESSGPELVGGGGLLIAVHKVS
jgi:hypothetical protein